MVFVRKWLTFKDICQNSILELHADLRGCNTRIYSDRIDLSSHLFPCLITEVAEGELLKADTLGGLL